MARNIIKKYTRPPKEIIHNYTVIQNPKNSGVYLLHFSTFTPELAELNMTDIDSSIMNTRFGKHIPNLNVLRIVTSPFMIFAVFYVLLSA